MSLQQLLKQLSNHIIFRSLHYAFIALQLRDELANSPGGRSSQKMRPFAIWLAHIMAAYAGDIIVNILLGVLPLEPLNNFQDVALCSVVWYIIFYSPCDVGHAVARNVACRSLAAPVGALTQVLHIERGVQLASQIYGQNAAVPILIVGTVIGSGAEFLRPIVALFVSRCQLNHATYVKLSTNSKMSLGISGLYVLQLNHCQLLPALTQRNQLQLYVLFALMTYKFLDMFYRMDELIWRLEQRFTYILFGELYTDLSSFIKRQLRPARSRHRPFSKFD